MAVEFPRFLQTKQYSAKMLRDIFLDSPIQNGVVGPNDLLVGQRGAGANMSVDIASGSGWVKGTSSARQGMYNLYNDATVNVTITAANATNPRIDQIVMRVYDSSDGGSAQDIGAVEVVTGTATAGATLANRTGAGALPAHSVLLADILVPAASASVTSANIRDRRPWARGLDVFRRGVTSGPSVASGAIIPEMDIWAEFSGADVEINFMYQAAAAQNTVDYFVNVDGGVAPTAWFGGSADHTVWTVNNTANSSAHLFWRMSGHTPGRHQIQIRNNAASAQTYYLVRRMLRIRETLQYGAQT